MDSLRKATWIDGIAATESRDSQNETLNLKGADITQMTVKGYFNDNHGTGMINTLGRITKAKKIFKKEDCEDDRQKMYWEKTKAPFLYTSGYLFDEADHPNAKAVAAIMKEFKKMGTPLDVKMSVEGKVLERDPHDHSHLKESMIRNVALTLVPANGDTGASILRTDMRKGILAEVAAAGGNPQYADNLMKSMGMVDTVDTTEIQFGHLRAKINDITQMVKMLSAGAVAGGSDAKVGGAVMVPESLHSSQKKKVLKTIMKAAMQKYPTLPLDEIIGLSEQVFNKRFKEID